MRRIVAATAGLAALTLISGCSTVSTAPDKVALHYKGGPLSSTKFANCVEASTRNIDGPADAHYTYPVSQRAFDATGGNGADAKPFTVVSNDNSEMRVPATLTVTLRSDCKTLREFHERIGGRYQAYFDGDEASDGWVKMLNFVVGKPFDTALDRAAQKYNWRDLWNDPATKAAFEAQVRELLVGKPATGNIPAVPGLITTQAGGTYFDVNAVTILKPEPVSESLRTNVANEQAAVASAKSAKAEAEAREASAKAQLAVEQAEAAKIQARIKVLGRDGWLKEQAISKGLNPWQPVIVPGVPQGS
jgi:hypothetical protein